MTGPDWRKLYSQHAVDRVRPVPQSRFQRVHSWVKEAEPWGIWLAVFGLLLATWSFWFDYSDKVEERTVRAWQLLTTKAPGNSGKREALEYLNKRDGIWCRGESCLFTLKQPESLSGIDLSPEEGQLGAFLFAADLRGANLFRANLHGANLSGSDLTGSDLSEVDLGQATIVDASLGEIDAFYASLSAAVLLDSDLSGSDLTKVDFRGSLLSGSDLSGADLTGANLNQASLENVDLRRANLSGATLKGVYFRDVNLHGASFHGAVLVEAKGLSQRQLDRACGDKKTRLDSGFTIPMCSEVDWYESIHGNRPSITRFRRLPSSSFSRTLNPR